MNHHQIELWFRRSCLALPMMRLEYVLDLIRIRILMSQEDSE